MPYYCLLPRLICVLYTLRRGHKKAHSNKTSKFLVTGAIGVPKTWRAGGSGNVAKEIEMFEQGTLFTPSTRCHSYGKATIVKAPFSINKAKSQ